VGYLTLSFFSCQRMLDGTLHFCLGFSKIQFLEYSSLLKLIFKVLWRH
jgi:hypothetical protein